MENLLKKLLKLTWIDQNDKVLVVCGNHDDDKRLKDLKFSDYLITSIYNHLPGVRQYKKANVQKLPFTDSSFDVVLVNAGLHHCDSPHLALTEMYRVAKKMLIVREAQDSLFIRLMVKLKIAQDYEISAIKEKCGGLNDTSIPNFVYRWNKNEVRKTLSSYDPTRVHQIIFFSSFQFYPSFLASDGSWENKSLVKFFGKRLIKIIIDLSVSSLNLVVKNQGNEFAFVVRKNISPFQKWIKVKG